MLKRKPADAKPTSSGHVRPRAVARRSGRNAQLRNGQERTRRKLLSEAMALVGGGRVPSIAEIALSAGVSRATAYRYFPSRSKLIAAVVAESLLPVQRFEPGNGDGRQRVRELFDHTFPQFKTFEPQMRAALQLSLEHESLERAGLLEEEAYRRGMRRELLSRAAHPLKRQLGGKGFDRLIKALSILYGIEPYVVLKDIWGASDGEVEAIARWMVDAVFEAALKPDEQAASHKPARREQTGSDQPKIAASNARPDR
jgi:AcrR family transcriptional regulator